MNSGLRRYHRQCLINDIGEAGQQRLRDSTVLLLGCGALGSVAADLLSRAGVGQLVIADRDVVEETNLQRQLLFDERDVADGLPKAEAARRRIAETNSEVRVTAIVDDIDHSNIARIADGADLLLDGLDNLETRYLANDLAVSRGLPYLYGAAVGTAGTAFAVLPRHGTPCFRCLFPEVPASGTMPTCDTVGVLGSLIATIASFQVTEALKILTGNRDKVCRKMLHVDVWSNEFHQLDVSATAAGGDCPCCRRRSFEYLSGVLGSSAVSLCGRNAVQLRHKQGREPLDLDAIARRLDGNAVKRNEFMLRLDVRERDSDFEISVFSDGRAIIKGTDDTTVARNLYTKYIGT